MPDLLLDPLVYLYSNPFMSTHTTTTLPDTIISFVSSASIEQKQHLLSLLTDDIRNGSKAGSTTNKPPNKAMSEPKPSSSTSLDNVPQISHYVEHVPELDISEELSTAQQRFSKSLPVSSSEHVGQMANLQKLRHNG